MESRNAFSVPGILAEDAFVVLPFGSAETLCGRLAGVYSLPPLEVPVARLKAPKEQRSWKSFD